MLQRTLSLGSLGGIVALVIGVAVAMLILTQFEFGRKLTGANKGQVSLK
jgi:hypothetical protein